MVEARVRGVTLITPITQLSARLGPVVRVVTVVTRPRVQRRGEEQGAGL